VSIVVLERIKNSLRDRNQGPRPARAEIEGASKSKNQGFCTRKRFTRLASIRYVVRTIPVMAEWMQSTTASGMNVQVQVQVETTRTRSPRLVSINIVESRPGAAHGEYMRFA
jgi:hypothetical protein